MPLTALAPIALFVGWGTTSIHHLIRILPNICHWQPAYTASYMYRLTYSISCACIYSMHKCTCSCIICTSAHAHVPAYIICTSAHAHWPKCLTNILPHIYLHVYYAHTNLRKYTQPYGYMLHYVYIQCPPGFYRNGCGTLFSEFDPTLAIASNPGVGFRV